MLQGHRVDDNGVVWYGGIGHRLLTDDDGGEDKSVPPDPETCADCGHAVDIHDLRAMDGCAGCDDCAGSFTLTDAETGETFTLTGMVSVPR